MATVLPAERVETGRNPRTIVPILAATFLAATHGGVGYHQWSLLVYASVVVAIAASLWFLARARFRVDTVQLAVVGMIVLLMLFPAVVAAATLGSKVGFTFLVCNVTAFLLFAQTMRRYKEDGTRVIAKTFLLAAAASVLIAAVVVVRPITVGNLTFGAVGYFRPLGTFSTPNRFGEVAAVGTLAATFLFLSSFSGRFRYGALALVFALATVASGSKGVILGLLAALPCFLVFTNLLRRRVFWRTAVVLLPLAGLLAYQMWDYILLATKLDEIAAGSLDVGSGRGVIWATALELFQSAPMLNQVLGHGASFFAQTTGRDPHSTYLYLLVDYGLVSLLWLPLLVWYAIVALVAQPSRRSHFALAAGLMAFCLGRGVAMPTVFTTFNFAMLAFWAGLAILLVPAPRPVRDHA
jgi:O-antigen ligase